MMRTIRSERGASAVEFALVLPLLLFLTFGLIEFGILLFDKAVITNASREGARTGIVYATDADGDYAPISDTEIRTVVKSYANGRLINLGSATNTLTDGNIAITPANRTSNDDLTITVSFIYNFMVLPDLSALLGGGFNGTITLQGVTRMRME
jgi:Flp pilus assembly protein TadG